MRFPRAPDSGSDSALERLQKSVNEIIIELNVLKELQALQTGSDHSPPDFRKILQNFINKMHFG